MERAAFSSLANATVEDWDIIQRPSNVRAERQGLAERLIGLLAMQKDDPTYGWPVNVYTHCLQTATRAKRDGADPQTIFCALLHDATEGIDLENHCETAALLVQPYVSSDHFWMIRMHGLFQDWHAHTHPIRKSSAYLLHRGHSAFDLTLRFTTDWDQCSFDPDFVAEPLEQFVPIVRRVVMQGLDNI
jgi:predicted HD phosphohydrolase